MKATRPARRTAAALIALILSCPQAARANGQSAALRARAASELYNLNHDRALATFREAVAADPQDPAAYRGLAIEMGLNISFRRGNMTVDDYLGSVSVGRQAGGGSPSSEPTAGEFQETL